VNHQKRRKTRCDLKNNKTKIAETRHVKRGKAWESGDGKCKVAMENRFGMAEVWQKSIQRSAN
jgi:hypothetical protein